MQIDTGQSDADTSSRHSLGMLKSVRSLHGDSPQHSHAIARDFALPPTPVSSLLHENCSSLKDQFLKIKERFSAPSPTAAAKTPVAAPSLSPSNALSSSATTDTEEKVATASASHAPPVDHINATAPDVELKPLTRSDAQPPSDASAQSATKVSAGDATWPTQSPVQVERWYVEDNYFKGSLTCWTMDRGAAIVSRIAAVVAAAESESAKRINPDISLQWIGRQLWAITVALPLTRSGELKDEHMALAARIDEAIANEAPPTAIGARSSSSSSVVSPTHRLQTLASTSPDCESDNQVPTIVLRDPDALNGALDSRTNALASAAAGAGRASSDISGESKTDQESGGAPPPADLFCTPDASSGTQDANSTVATASIEPPNPGLTAPVPPCSATPIKYSNASVSTVVAEDEYVRELDDESQSSHSQSVHDDIDVVASLPISWSMLSTTSLPESVGGSLNSNDPRDDDPRSPPEMTGWLKKKTGLNSWQSRYFELKGNRLYYFANETDGVPRGAIVLDHAHVLRGKGDQCMTFSITTSGASHSLQIVKFSARMTPHVHARKSCVLRVIYESDESVTSWVTALNRASFYCNLSVASASGATSATGALATSLAQTPAFASPGKKKKVPFYRLRTSSSSASSADDESKHSTGSSSMNGNTLSMAPTLDGASYHHYGSVKYLQDTDPLLWEIHPHDQVGIRKRAALARTKADYLTILSKYSATFKQIFLPRPRPISLEQTLRDILPELFLINNVLYGGGDENNGLENIFEVLDSAIKRFASAQDERVRAVSTLLQACARTISGGDSYFVIHSLLGNPNMIIRPAEARGHPIEIDVSPTNPTQILITVFSAFSFHHIDDVEKYGDTCDSGSGSSSMTPEPLLRVRTYHIQEFDFGSGKSSRWLQIRADGMKDDSSADTAFRHTWTRRDGSETGFGALLDALS